MQQILVQQGLDLTLYGMGTVYVFLTLLVICTMIMSAVIDRYFRESRPDPVAAPDSANSEVTPHILAVIQAAIHEHRAKNKK